MKLVSLEKEINNLVTGFIFKHFELEKEAKGDPYYWLEVHFTKNDLFGIVNISDYFLNMSDVYYDMKNDIPKGKILEWHDEVTDLATAGKKYINFSSYCMNNFNMVIEGKK